MASHTVYVAPRRGCAYEEESVRMELFYAARVLDLRSPRLQHILGEDQDLLDEEEEDFAGPLLVEVPRKYLIEANPTRYPVPTPAQLAVPAPQPTLDDRLRRESGRT